MKFIKDAVKQKTHNTANYITITSACTKGHKIVQTKLYLSPSPKRKKHQLGDPKISKSVITNKKGKKTVETHRLTIGKKEEIIPVPY